MGGVGVGVGVGAAILAGAFVSTTMGSLLLTGSGFASTCWASKLRALATVFCRSAKTDENTLGWGLLWVLSVVNVLSL